MCCGCWTDDGEHQLDTPLVRAIAALHEDVDPFGCLHIVVADDNLDTDDIQWCYDHRNGLEPKKAWTVIDQQMYDLLMAATWEERVSAMGLWNGCWSLPPARVGGSEA